MDLRLLTYFVAVAEELSVTRAARRLHIAQPSLSQQLLRLERDLGAELVDRSVRPLALTAAGQRLLVDSYRLLGMAEDTARAVAALGADKTSELRVGLPIGGLFDLARHAFGEMAKHMPNVAITPVLIPDAESVPLVHRSEIDLAVIRDIGNRLPLGLQAWPLAPEPLLVALPAAHPLCNNTRVPLSELAHEHFITFPRRTEPTIYDRQQAACQDAGFQPLPGPEVDDPQARDLLITLGHGISLVGAGSAHRFPAVTYLPVDPPTTISHITAIGRSGQPAPPLAALIEHLFTAAPMALSTPRSSTHDRYS